MAAPSVQVGVRHQREIARALDRRRELGLVMSAGSGDPRRNDLAVLADEVFEQIDVLVVDPLDLLRGETAELAALEELLRALLIALAVAALAFFPAFAPPPRAPRVLGREGEKQRPREAGGEQRVQTTTPAAPDPPVHPRENLR